jgi:uncharacterized membrane protein YphA (DoxX/SURF4 family)
MNRALWIVQGLLSPLFLFAGGVKFFIPLEEMAQSGLPGEFILFIGVAEVLGGIGLVVPTLTRIRPELTPLAAAGLVIIMIGATAMMVADGGVVAGLFPLVVGVLAAFVAYGRWQVAPRRQTAPALQPAS